jgi:hypothetical protein
MVNQHARVHPAGRPLLLRVLYPRLAKGGSSSIAHFVPRTRGRPPAARAPACSAFCLARRPLAPLDGVRGRLRAGRGCRLVGLHVVGDRVAHAPSQAASTVGVRGGLPFLVGSSCSGARAPVGTPAGRGTVEPLVAAKRRARRGRSALDDIVLALRLACRAPSRLVPHGCATGRGKVDARASASRALVAVLHRGPRSSGDVRARRRV